MLAAHRLGMTDGSYAFFNIVLFDSSYFGNIGWERGDADDENAKAAYRALMTFTLHKKKSPVFEEFALDVKERALKEFNFSYDAIGEEVRNTNWDEIYSVLSLLFVLTVFIYSGIVD